MLKRFLIALLCLASVPALGAMNIRQSGDGTATWQGRETDTFPNCVGGWTASFPQVRLDSGIAYYYPVPITRAIIKGAYGVSYGTAAGTGAVYIHIDSTTDSIGYTNSGHTLLTEAFLNFSGASAGTTARLSTVGQVTGATKVISNTGTTTPLGTSGSYVAVVSNGNSSTVNASAAVLVRICPR